VDVPTPRTPERTRSKGRQEATRLSSDERAGSALQWRADSRALRVLQTQQQVREDGPAHVRHIELIRMEELREIRRIWLNEKYEFDDAVPRIYREVTGEEYPGSDERDELLGPDEWELLGEVCGGDQLLFELSTHLLGREREYRAMSRRIGVYTALEATLSTRGFLSREEAIDAARLREPTPVDIDPMCPPKEPA
jgi:DNA sulfur modification protein DndC